MQESVDLRRCDGDEQQLRLVAPGPSSQLVHEAHIGAGVHVGVDLVSPDRWFTVAVGTLDDTSAPLLGVLIGEDAVRLLRCEPGLARLTVDTGGAVAWLRVAVVDAIDRWLQLPLDQALVDAERGVSRAVAATTLPTGSAARGLVVGDALRLARRASAGVRRYLRRRGPADEGTRMHEAVERLVDGYAALATEVPGPDSDLAAVVRAGRAARARVTDDGPASGVVPPRHRRRSRRRPSASAASSMIDPRQVRARVLALSADPAAGEVDLSSVSIDDRDAVQVRVPAFRRTVDEDAGRRLLVRLIDRLTDDPHSQTLLTIAGDRPYYHGTMPLRGSLPADLRVDVFDALSEVPPARADTDAALRDVRRGAVFLREWRGLVALALLSEGMDTASLRLQELVEGLRPDEAGPMFAGGPAAEDLLGLAARGDAATLTHLRAAGGAAAPGDRALASVWGAGRLLVAEWACAHENPAP